MTAAGRPSRQRQFFRSAITGFAASNLNAIIQLVGFAVLIRALDLDTYGAVLLAGYIIAQVQTFDGGLLQSVERYIPHYKSTHQSERITALIGLSLGGLTLLGTFAGAIVLVAAAGFPAAGWIDGPDASLNEVAWATAALLPLAWPAQGLRNVAFGFLRHEAVYAVDLVTQTLAVALSIVAALLDASAVTIVLARSAPLILAAVPLGWVVRRANPVVTWRPESRHVRAVIVETRSYTGWVIVMKLSLVLRFVAERSLPAAMLGLAAVPLFDGVLRVVKFAIGLNNGFKQIALPIAARLTGEARQNDLDQLAINGTRVMTAAFAPVLVMTAVFSPVVLHTLGGSRMTGMATALALELVILAMLIPRALVSRLLQGHGRHMGEQAAWAVSSNAAYVGVMAVMLHMGGVEWAILAHGLTHIAFMPWFVCIVHRSGQFMTGRVIGGALQALLPSLIGGGIIAILLYWTMPMRDITPEHFWLGPVLGVLLAAASFRFGLPGTARKALAQHLLPNRQ